MDRDVMTELYLLRHAHAGDPAEWEGPDDARPLSKRGRRQTERLATFLAAVAFQPDVVVTSPKTRARQTAEGLLEALGAPLRVDERLGAGFDMTDLEQLLVELGDPRRPVLVGHDPDLSDLLADLTGIEDVTLRKGAFARIDIARPAGPGTGVLAWLVPPDLLDPGR